jgi:hypothetical protein
MSARSLAIFASTIAFLSLTPVQAGNYDGPWSVELSTEQGQCGLNYKGQLNVAGGRIARRGSAGDEPAAPPRHSWCGRQHGLVGVVPTPLRPSWPWGV